MGIVQEDVEFGRWYSSRCSYEDEARLDFVGARQLTLDLFDCVVVDGR